MVKIGSKCLATSIRIFFLRWHHKFFHFSEEVADGDPDGLASVGIPAPGYEFVESLNKSLRNMKSY